MRFLVDAQLPADLARWLVERGLEAWHVTEFDLGAATDQEIWRQALLLGAVILTKDRDFADWAVSRRPSPGVVWLRCGNVSRRALVELMEREWPQVQAHLDAGAALVEAGRP